MKFFQKYIYWVCGTLILLVIAYFCLVKEDLSVQSLETLPQFYIETAIGKEKISIFHPEEKNYYVFLPSYADMKQLKVRVAYGEKALLGESKLISDMDCSGFELEKGYNLIVNGNSLGELKFYQSANISTMHIDTATGSIKYINDNKEHEENVSIRLYTADGRVDGSYTDGQLKGRGNSTWNYEKRPYTLTFTEGKDLLEMGEAQKWILLANAREEECLNNKIAFDLASGIGNVWTPGSHWVDLYLNGEYSGLYLLTEKVEVGTQRLNIDINEGDFLGKIDYEERWDTLSNPFISEAGRTVEISSPDILTETDKNRIIELTNQMEYMILSGENIRDNFMLDLDSWIYRYLLDEILGNIDADLASSYFYYKDGVFYAGPVWDYDATLGNENSNQDPNAFMAKNLKKSELESSIYYNALYKKESFYGRMVEIYEGEFLPVLEQLIDEGLDEMAAEISQSIQMNQLRWESMYETSRSKNQNTVQTLGEIKKYLQQRVQFLNNAWINNVDYCTVQFENSRGNKYWNISVEKGTCLKTNYVDLENTYWVDEKTGEPVDFGQPVSRDFILVQPDNSRFITSDYVTFLSIAILLALFMGFAVVEIYGFHTKRRR